MEIVEAPNDFLGTRRPWLFLGGTIEQDTAENWQERVCKDLEGEFGTILNPRRKYWDTTWGQSMADHNFRHQVEWELDALGMANTATFYFQPGTMSPVTLMELGLMTQLVPETSDLSCNPVVYCPDGFWRKGNVDIVCERSGTLSARSWDEFIELIKADLELARHAYGYAV